MLILVQGRIFWPDLKQIAEVCQTGVQGVKFTGAQFEREGGRGRLLRVSGWLLVVSVCHIIRLGIFFGILHVGISVGGGFRLIGWCLLVFGICRISSFHIICFHIIHIFDLSFRGGLLSSWLAFGWPFCGPFASRNRTLLCWLSSSVNGNIGVRLHE